jgi:hypothetical protein
MFLVEVSEASVSFVHGGRNCGFGLLRLLYGLASGAPLLWWNPSASQ